MLETFPNCLASSNRVLQNFTGFLPVKFCRNPVILFHPTGSGTPGYDGIDRKKEEEGKKKQISMKKISETFKKKRKDF